MRALKQPGRRLRRAGDSGQDLVEYALLTGLIGIAAGAMLPTQVAPAICRIFSKLHNIMVTNFNG
jgi:Flp pilus assembly pilin Flp